MEITPHPQLKEYARIQIDVQSLESIKDYRNLLDGKALRTISATVVADALEKKKIKPGSPVYCHLRVTQNRENFINPESIRQDS